MVSNPHLSAALTCVAIRRLLAGAMARSNRRRRRLRRILAMCQWQGGKGLYMQLNATAPILTVYANPEACLKKDFRVKRSSVVYLVQMLSSPKDHGWGQDIEVLVLLYSLAHGLSLSVVDMNDVLEDAEAFPPEDGDQSPPPAAACGQESPGHHLRNRIAAQLSAPVQMAPHLREHDYI
ncbi:hypothetical protein KUCAC02_026317 [Chaenocephalus aceratus]|uniref:Uncharacterized protein n=1 Tax=Chaenocephalus aceratus TaxID=36190 RepID=A0ACB9VXW7_CHAAC|nr:hypothetical protein KUCAC02_026317 [Chaenocephalus aceratus]